MWASLSATFVEQVRGFPSSTTVTTSGSPSVVGQPVMFTATVMSTHGAIPDGELVTFYDGSTEIGTGRTASGVATFTTSSLAVKTHLVKGAYSGDLTLAPSTGSVKQVVEKCTTATSLGSSANPSAYRQAVTFTATVTRTGPYAPSGYVKFKDGTNRNGIREVERRRRHHHQIQASQGHGPDHGGIHG